MSSYVSSKIFTPTKTLRQPFKAVFEVGSTVSSKVNQGCEATITTVTKNSYVVKANQSYTKANLALHAWYAAEANMPNGRIKAFNAKTKPYIQPVIPYIEKAKPFAVPVLALAVILATIPILAFIFFAAAITFPIWGFFALITSFFWVPPVFICAIFFGLTSFFVTSVVAIRFFSKPTGKAVLEKFWTPICSNAKVQKILYVQ